MKKIKFESGTKVKDATVTIDEVEHIVTPAEWSGNTPLTPYTLNKLQDNIEEAINGSITKITLATEITANTNYTVPKYTVGANDLEVYYEGCKLVKDVNYEEVGNAGEKSTIIKFGWDVRSGTMLEFIVKGEA